jgi:hypothetical protein
MATTENRDLFDGSEVNPDLMTALFPDAHITEIRRKPAASFLTVFLDGVGPDPDAYVVSGGGMIRFWSDPSLALIAYGELQ